jgi:hypothetical protein
VATKKDMTTNFFSPLSFVAVFGSGMDKNQDPASWINIPDPKHWFQYFIFALLPSNNRIFLIALSHHHMAPIKPGISLPVRE